MGASQPEPGATPEVGSDYEVVVSERVRPDWRSGTSSGRRAGFAILEAADSIGSAWRDRWDSLTLFTPRYAASGPPVSRRSRGLSRPRRGDRLPGALRGDVRARDRAEQPGAGADSGRRQVRPRGRREDDYGRPGRRRDGPFQKPFVPELANRLGPDLVQMHATGYRKPSDIREGTVLVVGGGNTGFQIAKELSRTHRVALAVGSKQTPLPQRLLGRDLFWWLTKSRLFNTTIDSRLGRRLSTRDTLIGSRRELRRRYGVELKPRRRRRRPYGAVRGRERGRSRRGHLGDRIPARLLLDRPPHLRRGRPAPPPARRDRRSWSVLPRFDLATHARLGADRLGQEDAEFIAEQIEAFQETRSRPTDVRLEQRERI